MNLLEKLKNEALLKKAEGNTSYEKTPNTQHVTMQHFMPYRCKKKITFSMHMLKSSITLSDINDPSKPKLHLVTKSTPIRN